MISRKSLAALMLVACSFTPSITFAESGASSSSASGFSWFANTPSPASAQARAATRANLVINTSRTWVCSPAGSGRRSTCVSG